jgi:hypothetical protein
MVRMAAAQTCDDRHAMTAFQAWRDLNLTPSFN